MRHSHNAAYRPEEGSNGLANGSNAIVVLVTVIGTSIALRKVVPNQTTRIAIGIVEVILIAILVVGIVRSR